MSEEAPGTEAKTATKAPAPRRRFRPRVHRSVLVAVAVTLGILALVAGGVRLGVRTDSGRAFAMRTLEGLKLGRFGRLHIEGLSGDLFGAFEVKRLAIVDAKGPWLEARNLSVVWRPLELSLRRVHATKVHAEVIQILRRPVVTPSGEGGGKMPVSIRLDDVKTRLESYPAFSKALGVWDVAAQVRIRRNGPATGRVDAVSRIHAGDGLKVAFQFGPKGKMLLQADAVEAQGGALAGAMGLAADQRLLIRGRIDGVKDASGKFSIIAESGAIKPVVAQGGWGPSGGSADARLLLGASTLTAGYAARVGPELQVRLRATHAKGDLYTVQGTAFGRDAAVVVNGPLDWRRRRVDGLGVRATVRSLKAWVEPLHAGRTLAQGKLTGAPDRWRYQGQVEVNELDQFGFKAARFSGPATVSGEPGDIRLQADLQGVGGQGVGLIPALLGARPRIKLDGSRLKDGRLLARALHVDGAGLKLDASGDRSLLGLLSFKGDLELSGLERAHGGAKGKINASWSAGQSGIRPWRVRYDAKGAGFASGYPELDRLLGPAPRLVGEADYSNLGLAIDRTELTGDKAGAIVTGALKSDQTLDLNVNWRASGPFTLGPVEIAGEAVGTGRVAGRVSAPSLDLDADLASIDFGRLVIKPAHLSLLFFTEGGANGQIAVTGPTEFGPASAKAGFRFIPGGLALNDIAADAGGVRASGALTLTNGAPSTADLTIDARKGAFLSSGRLSGQVKIADAAGGATARINLEGRDLAAYGFGGQFKLLTLNADGPWARLPFTYRAEGPAAAGWRFAGEGLLEQSTSPQGAVREATLNGSGRVRGADVKTLEAVRIRLEPAARSARLRLAVGKGRLDVDARQAGAAVEATAKAADLEVAAFNPEYVGQVTGSLRLSGAGERLAGSMDAAMQDVRNRDAPANVALNGKVRMVLADNRVDIEAGATNSQGLTSSLTMAVPAEASAAPFRIALVRNRPVRGAFSAEGELRPIWDIFIGGGRTLSGKGSTEGTIGGTLAAIEVTGQAAVSSGRFQDAATGLDLRDVTLAASFGKDAIRVGRFTGADGLGGTLSGDGEINLARGGASSFQLQLNRFQLINNDLARASASGTVTVTRDAAGKAKLAGAITVVRADITAKPPLPTGVTPMDVIEINRPESAEAEFKVRPPGAQVALDVTIKAARGVFVRGNGLDVEFSVNAHVGGVTGATNLTGTARVVRGNYEFAGKRFEFDGRSTVRLGPTAEQIRLDLTATRDDPTLTALVRIEGTAARPEISLSSVPVLPQDEVLSQVLFGRTASQLTPLETAQLASALTALATGGGLDVLGSLRELANLDRLALGSDIYGQATVSGGKYITDSVYLEVTGGGRLGPTAQVEWRVRRNFSIVSTVGTRGDGRLSIRFRKGY